MGEWVGNCCWGGHCSGKLDSKINTYVLSLQKNFERRHFPQTCCNLRSKKKSALHHEDFFFWLPSSSSLPPYFPPLVEV